MQLSTGLYATIMAAAVTTVTCGQDPNSVVDYYRSTGRNPSFENRKTDFERLRPGDRYVGSAGQNLSLGSMLRLGDEGTTYGDSTMGTFRVPRANASFLPPEPFRTRLLHPSPSDHPEDCQSFYGSFQGTPGWSAAYLANAATACEVTGEGPKANWIRNCLQEQMQYPRNSPMSGSNLHDMHELCYQQAGCTGTPAPEWAWRIVNSVPMPKAAIPSSINRFGSCDGTPGVFEAPRSSSSLDSANLTTRTTARNVPSLSPPDTLPQGIGLGVDYTSSFNRFATENFRFSPNHTPAPWRKSAVESSEVGSPLKSGVTGDGFFDSPSIDIPGPTPLSSGAKAAEAMVVVGHGAWQDGMRSLGSWMTSDNCVPTIFRKGANAAEAASNAALCVTYGDGYSCASALQNGQEALKPELWNNCISRQK